MNILAFLWVWFTRGLIIYLFWESICIGLNFLDILVMILFDSLNWIKYNCMRYQNRVVKWKWDTCYDFIDSLLSDFYWYEIMLRFAKLAKPKDGRVLNWNSMTDPTNLNNGMEAVYIQSFDFTTFPNVAN